MLLREQVVLSSSDASRRQSGAVAGALKRLRGIVEQAERAADRARDVFAGLMDPRWMEEDLTSRVEPLREELRTLDPRVRQLDPSGWSALLRGE